MCQAGQYLERCSRPVPAADLRARASQARYFNPRPTLMPYQRARGHTQVAMKANQRSVLAEVDRPPPRPLRGHFARTTGVEIDGSRIDRVFPIGRTGIGIRLLDRRPS